MGSKAVFGILLIGMGILAAYLAITGNLAKVWSIITTGQNPPVTPQATTATTNTSVNNAPAAQTMTTQAPYLPTTTASQIQSALSDLQAIENYQPVNTLPSSATTTPTAAVSTLPSVYSMTLAQQSGVTGVVS